MPRQFDDYMRLVLSGGGTGQGTAPAHPNIPLADQGYTQGDFEDQIVEKETTGRGILGKVFNALGAGEYAVSSFLKAWHSGDENPFGAAMKGLYSAFTDDEEYETRMTDVLTEFGWTPEEGSWASTGKGVAGFALGVALDPLTWMGFGPAARALRINSQSIATWAKAAGIPTQALKGWGKGQALNKTGRKVYEYLLEKNTRKIAEAGGDILALQNVQQKTLWQMLNLSMPTDLLQGIAKKATKGGKKLKNELNWEELTKNRDVVKDVLGFLGKKADDAGIDSFVNQGYKELLDQGGLKFMGYSIGLQKAGYLTPNAASLTGFLLGDRMASNAPFLGRVGEKLKGTKADKIWNEMVAAPFRALNKRLNKYAGVPRHLRPWIDEAHATMGNAQQMKSAHINALSSYADPPSSVTGKKGAESEMGQLFQALPGMPTPQQHVNTITDPRQKQFLGQLMTSARYHQIERDDLDKYILDILNNTAHKGVKPADMQAMHEEALHWGLEKWSVKERYGIARVAENYTDFGMKLPRWEETLEIGEATMSPSYFAKRYRLGVGVPDDVDSLRKATAGDPFFFRKEQKEFYLPTRKNVKRLAEEGKIPGIPEFDAEKILDMRLSGTYSQAYQKDFLNRLAKVSGITPGAGEVLADLLRDKEWKGVMPEMTRLITRLSDRTTGVDAADLGNFSKFVTRLGNTKSTKQMKKLLDDFATDETMVANLSRENVESLMTIWDEQIAGKVSRAEGISIKKTADEWSEGATWMRNNRENLENILNQRGLETGVAKMQASAIEAIAPEGHRALWSDATKEGLEKARQIAPESAPMVSLADIEAGNAREMMMIRGQNLLKELGPDNVSRQDRFFARYADQFGKRADNLIARKDELKHQVQKIKDGKPLSMAPSRLAERSEGLTSEIRTRLAEVSQKIRRLGEVGVSDRRRAMGMWLYGTEFETLNELLQQIPGRGLTSPEGRKAIGSVNLWRQITKRAADLGVNEKKYMQTVIKQYGTGKTIDTMSRKELQLIKKSMDVVTEENAVAQTKRILSLGVEGTKFKELDLKRIKHLDDPVDGLPRPINQTIFEAPVVDEIKRAWEPEDFGFGKKALESFNSMTYAFKKWVTVGVGQLPRPAFYIRNIVDLAFRGTIGFGVRSWHTGFKHRGDIAKVLAGKEGEWTLRNGSKVPYDLVRSWLAQGDVWRHGIARMPRHHADEAIRWGEKMDKVFGTESTQRFTHSLRNANAKMTNLLEKYTPIPSIRQLEGPYSMENYATITALMSEVDAGIPVSQALKHIRENLFAFSGMTDTERYYLRSAIPFYTFSRQAVPFVGKLFVKNPKVPGLFARATDLAMPTPEDEAAIPKHIRDYPWATISRTPKGIKVLSMRNTFTVDIVNDLVPNMNIESLRGMIGQLNPLVVAPVEWMIGKQAFMQKDIKSRERIYRQLKTPFMQKTVGYFLNAEDVTYKGKEYLAVDGGKWHLLRRMWFSRLFRELDEYSSVIGGHGNEPLLGLLTGFKIVDLDQERQMQILGIEAQQAYRQYRHAVSTGDRVQVDRALEEYRLK